MIGAKIFVFVFVMWLLILIGGSLMVIFVGPISFTGYGELDPILKSVTQVVIAIILVTFWIVILTKVKNWIFHKQIER